jgi:hypothetical protein
MKPLVKYGNGKKTLKEIFQVPTMISSSSSSSSLYYYYYHAIIDVSVAKIKALSDIDLSFLLTSKRFPS